MNAQHGFPAGAAQDLLGFLSGLTTAALPEAVVREAKGCLLDGIGCALFGSTQPWGRIMAEEIAAESAQGACSVFGLERTVAAPAAALVNGTALHGFELDDLIAAAIVHPGCVVVPAVLAAAEAVDATGERLLRGLVAGYEASARLSAGLGMEPSHRGFHKTAVVGPPAAAIAAGVVSGASLAEMTAAVGLACSCASGIKSFAAGGGGGMVKRMHAGRAAEAGVRMNQLARRGFTGPATALDGRFGLLEVFGGESARAGCLTEALGQRWAVNDVWVKVYPICGWIQGVVQLLLALRGDGPIDPARVRKVRVGTSRFAVSNNADPAPRDTMGAQYSIPYCAAIALTGEPADPAAYAPETIERGAWRALAERVELFVDARAEAVYPAHFACRVEVHLDTSEVRQAELLDAHGTTADPCSAGERMQKFQRLARYVVPESKLARFLEAARALERAASVREVMALLR